MAYRRKTWTEKLADDKGLPKVARIEGKMTRKWGEGTMLIPAPREVDAEMREVKRGGLATINDLRTQLAAKHGADVGCPITTGIFAWIAAHAAAEQEAAGKKRVTPWWRTVKAGGELNPKYPGGCEEQARRLRAEGHRVAQKGKRWLVEMPARF
jgi:hypothetical protein